MRPADYFKAIGFIAICQLAGLIGTIFTIGAISTWYTTLNKPPFNPPNWLFGPVWTILYTLMGISAYIVYRKGLNSNNVKEALNIFWLQLFLNSLWSIIFFGMKNPPLALIEIIFMWIAILVTIIKFYKISKTASYLLIPYLLWVSFASILNLFIVLLN